MKRTNPDNTPEFEDPAWQTINKTLLKWYNNMEKELQDLLQTDPSPERDAKLMELHDMVRSLGSAYGTHFEAIERNVRDKRLSNGQTWQVPGASSKNIDDLRTAKYAAFDKLLKNIESGMSKNAKSSLKDATATAKAGEKNPLPVSLRFARLLWTATGQGQLSKSGAPAAAKELSESGGMGPDVQIPVQFTGNQFKGTLETKEKDITRHITFSGEIDTDLSTVRNLKVSSWTTYIFGDQTGNYNFREEWEFEAPPLYASKTFTKADLAIKSLPFYLRTGEEKGVKKLRYNYSGQSVQKSMNTIESMSLKIKLDPDVLPK
jgi:hypothetical protein